MYLGSFTSLHKAKLENFRTCNVLPFSCTHLALWRERQGKRPEVHAKQKGFKNFSSKSYILFFDVDGADTVDLTGGEAIVTLGNGEIIGLGTLGSGVKSVEVIGVC